MRWICSGLEERGMEGERERERRYRERELKRDRE